MNRFKQKMSALIVTAVAGALHCGAAETGGVKIEHLGPTHTLVRVNPTEGRYLMMPVQETNNDTRIIVLVDGKPVDMMFVRLARTRTDYSVPYDLSPYAGHDVILNIVSDNDRTNIREAKEESCWNNFLLADTLDLKNTEKFRPAFHHTPQYGWMNDPNGMFYKDGVWHLYYQYNPYGSKWQNMTWGHSTSKDLITWNHEPIAIRPDGLGDIFSGSSVIDKNNTAGFGEDAVIAMYTSAGASQMQSLASSTDDGMTFTVYPGNPVLTLESEARDPNIFFNEETGLWTMILAHALEKEMLIFTSPDMKEWTLTDSFGKGLGAQDGVWECPDLMEIDVDGGRGKKWILLCNINPGGPFGGSGCQYFIGDFDGKKFTVDTLEDGTVPTLWLDYGKDNYAIVSWHNAPDGRHPIIGWMSNWQYAAEVPTMQFRSANTLPRELGLFLADDGRIYASNAPSPEVDALRDKLVTSVREASVGTKARKYALPVANNGICEISMTVADAHNADEVILTLANAKDEESKIIFNPSDRTLSFDRTKSGETGFSQDFPAVTTAPLFWKQGEVELRIFVDTSSIEIFADNGKSVMTNLVFPSEPYTTLSVATKQGKCQLRNLKIHSLKATTLN